MLGTFDNVKRLGAMEFHELIPETDRLFEHRSRYRQAEIDEAFFDGKLLRRDAMDERLIASSLDGKLVFASAQRNDMYVVLLASQAVCQMEGKSTNTSPAGLGRKFA